MKFKVGDRVAVYYTYNRHIGNISDVSDSTVRISGFWYHEKQCRRLVKKQKEYIYVPKSGVWPKHIAQLTLIEWLKELPDPEEVEVYFDTYVKVKRK